MRGVGSVHGLRANLQVPAIQEAEEYIEQRLREKAGGAAVESASPRAVRWLQPRRVTPACRHIPPAGFRPGEPVELDLTAPGTLAAVTLFYRHVNQAESYQTAEMENDSGRWRQKIPSIYSRSVYPVLYYFGLRDREGRAWIYPGLESDLSNQPYFVLQV